MSLTIAVMLAASLVGGAPTASGGAAAAPTRTDWPGGAPVETLPLSAGEPIPLPAVRGLTYDDAQDRLLIRGSGDMPLVTATADGRIQGAVPGVDEATELLLDHEGEHLYVSQLRQARILELSRATLEVTRVFDTGPDACPARLGLTRGLLWFSDDECDGHYAHQVGAVDLATGEVHTDVAADGVTWRPLGSYPTFASTAARPDEMVVASSGDQHYRVRVGRTPTPSLTVLAQRTVFATRQLAYDVDGASVVLGSHNGGSQLRLDADTLEQVAEYPTGDRPTTLAFGRDGTLVAGNEGLRAPDVFVFGPGRPTAHRIYDFGENRPGSYQFLAPRGLAVGDGRVYAVKVDNLTNDPRLLTLDTRVTPRPRLTTPQRVLTSGTRGHVTLRLGRALSDQRVRLVLGPRASRGAPRSLVRRTDAEGAVTVGHVFRRTTVVTAEVPPDARAEAARARSTVRVGPRLTARWATGRGSGRVDFDPGVRPVIAGRVSPAPTRGHVTVDTRFVHPATGRVQVLPTRWRVPVRADGTYRTTLPLPDTRRPTRIRARVVVPGSPETVRTTSAWRSGRLLR